MEGHLKLREIMFSAPLYQILKHVATRDKLGVSTTRIR